MTGSTARRKIKTALKEGGILFNKIRLSGISEREVGCEIDQIMISLNVPGDSDIAKILTIREKLEMEEDISLGNVLIEL